MTVSEQISNKVEELREVPVEQVTFNPFQPRSEFSDDEIESLAESIKAVGIIHPPIVREIDGVDTLELVSGERRLRASQHAGLKTIPVLVRSFDDERSAEAALIENVQRVDLNPVEIAKALRNLIGEFSYSQEELAGRIGKKRSTVSNYLRLLALGRPIQKDIIAGRISMGHAKAILSVEGRELREALHQMILKQSLTVREAEAQAAQLRMEMPENKKSEKEAKKSMRQAAFQDVESRFREGLGSKVTIQARSRGKGGKLVIEFTDDEDLDRLYQQMV